MAKENVRINKILRIKKYNDGIKNKTIGLLTNSGASGIFATTTGLLISDSEFINSAVSAEQKVIFGFIFGILTAISGFGALKINTDRGEFCQAKLRLEEELNLPPYYDIDRLLQNPYMYEEQGKSR